MVRRNVPLERKLIEQRGLFDLTMSHHDLQSCLLQRLNQRTSCVATEDFFNKIGQNRKGWPRAHHVRYSLVSRHELERAACRLGATGRHYSSQLQAQLQ